MARKLSVKEAKKIAEQPVHGTCALVEVRSDAVNYKGEPIMGCCPHEQYSFLLSEKTGCRYYKKKL